MYTEMIYLHNTCVVKFRHRFIPLSKVVNINNDITMPPSQVRDTCHKVDTPFHKGANNYNGMQWSRCSMKFTVIGLACMTLLDSEDEVTKNSRPKETST